MKNLRIISNLLPLLLLNCSARCSRLSYKPMGTIKLEVPTDLLVDRWLLLSLRDDGSEATLRAVSKSPNHQIIKLTNEDLKTAAVHEIIRRRFLENSENEDKNQSRKVLMIPIGSFAAPGTRSTQPARSRVNVNSDGGATIPSLAQAQLNKTHGDVKEEFLLVMVENEETEEDIEFDDISDLTLIVTPRAVAERKKHAGQGSTNTQEETKPGVNALKNIHTISNLGTEAQPIIEGNINLSGTQLAGRNFVTTQRPVGVQLPLPQLNSVQKLVLNSQQKLRAFPTALDTLTPTSTMHTARRPEEQLSLMPTSFTTPVENVFDLLSLGNASLGVPLPLSEAMNTQPLQHTPAVPAPVSTLFLSSSQLTSPVLQPAKTLTGSKRFTSLVESSERLLSQPTKPRIIVSPTVGVPLLSARPFDSSSPMSTTTGLDLGSSTKRLTIPVTSPFIVKNLEEINSNEEIEHDLSQVFSRNASSLSSGVNVPITITDGASKISQSEETLFVIAPSRGTGIKVISSGSSEDGQLSSMTRKTSIISPTPEAKLFINRHFTTGSSEISSVEDRRKFMLFTPTTMSSSVRLLPDDILDNLTPDTIKDNSKESEENIIEDEFSEENLKRSKLELQIQLQPSDTDFNNELVVPSLLGDEKDTSFSGIISNATRLEQIVKKLREAQSQNEVAAIPQGTTIGVPLPGLNTESLTSQSASNSRFRFDGLPTQLVTGNRTLKEFSALSSFQSRNGSEFDTKLTSLHNIDFPFRLGSLRSNAANSADGDRQFIFNFPNQRHCPDGEFPVIGGKCRSIFQFFADSNNVEERDRTDQIGQIADSHQRLFTTKPVTKEPLSLTSFGIPLPNLRNQQLLRPRFNANTSAPLPSVGIPLPIFNNQPLFTPKPATNKQSLPAVDVMTKLGGRGSFTVHDSSKPISTIFVNRTHSSPTKSHGSQNSFGEFNQFTEVGSDEDIRQAFIPRVISQFRDSTRRGSFHSSVGSAERGHADSSAHRFTNHIVSKLPSGQKLHQSEDRNTDALIRQNIGIPLPSAVFSPHIRGAQSSAVNREDNLNRPSSARQSPISFNDHLLDLNSKDFLPPRHVKAPHIRDGTESVELTSNKFDGEHDLRLFGPSSLPSINHPVLPIHDHFTIFKDTTTNLSPQNNITFRNTNVPIIPHGISSSISGQTNSVNIKSASAFGNASKVKNEPLIGINSRANWFNSYPPHSYINSAAQLGSASRIHSNRKTFGPARLSLDYGVPPSNVQKSLFVTVKPIIGDSGELKSSYSEIGPQQLLPSSISQNRNHFLQYGAPLPRRSEQFHDGDRGLRHEQENFTLRVKDSLPHRMFRGSERRLHSNALAAKTTSPSANVNQRLHTHSPEFNTIADHLRRSKNSFSNRSSRGSSSTLAKSLSFSPPRSRLRDPAVSSFKPSPQLTSGGTVGFWRKGPGVERNQHSRFTRMTKQNLSLWQWANQL